jgi:AFG3 family protein
MINLLGKRPFVGRTDDMDKWLDDNRGSERSAPPPLESPIDPEPTPAPAPGVASSRLEDKAT